MSDPPLCAAARVRLWKSESSRILPRFKCWQPGVVAGNTVLPSPPEKKERKSCKQPNRHGHRHPFGKRALFPWPRGAASGPSVLRVFSFHRFSTRWAHQPRSRQTPVENSGGNYAIGHASWKPAVREPVQISASGRVDTRSVAGMMLSIQRRKLSLSCLPHKPHVS